MIKLIKTIKLLMRVILYLVFALKFITMAVGAVKPEYHTEITMEDVFIYGVVLVFMLSDEIIDELKEIKERIG